MPPLFKELNRTCRLGTLRGEASLICKIRHLDCRDTGAYPVPHPSEPQTCTDNLLEMGSTAPMYSTILTSVCCPFLGQVWIKCD